MKKIFAVILLFALLIPYNFVAAQEQPENLSVSESADSPISQTEDANLNLEAPTSPPVSDGFLNQGAGEEPVDSAGNPESENSNPENQPEADKIQENAEGAQTKDEATAEDESAPENPIPNPQSAPSDPWLNIAGLQELFANDLFTGEARLNIPFNVPSGRNGLSPKLGLHYSSFKNDLLSPYGYGWDFSLSSIFRTARYGVDQIYERQDFAVKLGGKYNELVLIDAGLGLYQGKLGNDANKYFLEGSGTNAKWRVVDTSAVQYYFGQADTSKQKDPDNPSHIFQWMLDKTVDPYGNQIAYTYWQDRNQIYPDTIKYVFTDETNSLYRVKFDYLQKSTSASSYQTQFKVETYYLLNSIKIQQFIESAWQTQKEYFLFYDYLDQAISRLLSITPKAGTQTLPALQFAYYTGGASINLLQTINNNKGGTIDLEYLPSTQYQDPETGERSQLPFIIDTLHKVTRVDQIASMSAIQTFDYYGGHYYVDYQDIFAREYAGFHKVISTDSLGQITKTYFHQSEFAKDNSASSQLGEYEDHISKKGRVYRQEIYDSQNHLFQSTITKWDKRALPGENRWLVWPSQTVNFTWDGDSSHKEKAETFQYDDFGNVLEQIEFGEVVADANTGAFTDFLTDKRTTQFAYALNESANIVSLPSAKIIKDYNNNQVQSARYYYDNQPIGQAQKGGLTSAERWLNTNGFYVQTNYEYNQYGLLIKQTDPLGNAISYQYDSYNLYPTILTNALGQQTQYTYDYSLGLLKSTIDPNSIVQENSYDGFGRLVKVQVSDQAQSPNLITKKEISYNDFVQPLLVLQKDYLSEETNPKETYQYFDGFGRIIQTKTSADQAGQFNTACLVYDELGRVKKEYLPEQTSNSNYQVTSQPDIQVKIYFYDALDRISQIQTAVGKTQNIYNLWQVQTVDPNNHQADKIYDAFGRLVQVNEHNGSAIYQTYYFYDSLNNLIKITDAEQNEREFVYDSLGRQTRNGLLHKAAGAPAVYNYEYDKNSNKIKETYPDGRSVNYSYDQLNRILFKDDPATADMEVQYLYDQSQFGISKLTKVQTPEYGFEYQYDGQGNVKEEDRSINKPQPESQILTGWAWSEKVGWISFNCKDREQATGKTCLNQTDPSFNPAQNLVDYSVKIDGSAGIISGYAWNENLYWISFNRQDTGIPPAPPFNEAETSFIAKADPLINDLTGWARALVFGSSATSSLNSPEFDGWIKLAGIAQDSSNYGVKINKQTLELEGWAWSNAGIGWVSFNCLNTNTCGAVNYQVKSKISESQEQSIDQNLAGYWAFNEGTGNIAYDNSGGGNNATLSNVSWVGGIVGKAGDYNATSSYGLVADNAAIQNIFDGGGSVSVVIKPDSDGKDDLGNILNKTVGTLGGWYLRVEQESAGFCKITFFQRFDGGTNGVWTSTPRIITLGAINHIVVVYDSDSIANDPIIYVNGVAVELTELQAGIGTRRTDAGYNLYIGAYATGADYNFDGFIDEARLYSIALTVEQAQYLYQNPAGSPSEFQAYSTKYSYDNYGALQSIIYPDNSTAEYDYNVLGKIKLVKENGQKRVLNISYSPTEAVSQISYNNGVLSVYTYDPNELYRLKNKSTTRPQSPNSLQNISYTYDPVGNITKIQDTGTQTPKDASYTYDDLNRLIHANINGFVENYSYSASGNILSKTGLGVYEYNDLCHPQAVTKAGSDTFSYDANGNLIAENRAGESISYSYDGFQRLINIQNTAGLFQYVYGNDYNRLQKILPNGKSITYLGELAEINELGEFTNYYFAGKLRIATVDKTGIYYNVSDHLSSASLEIDAAGNVVQKLDYLPFGQERLNEKTTDFETHFTFTDQEKDPESGLLYYGARYYNQSIGRFTQIDPVIIDTSRKEFNQSLQNPQLLNAFSYVGNNPLKYVDYEGEFAFLAPLIAAGLSAVPSIMTALNIALPMMPAMIDNPRLTGETAARTAPGLGDAIDIAESATGINAFSGEKLSGFERALTVGASVLPFVSGSVLRNADEALKNLPTQNHHLLTDKSQKFTPQFEKIINKYGLKLDGAWNIIEKMPHLGRHADKYHKYALEEVVRMDNTAQGVKDIFLQKFDQLKSQVQQTPEMLQKAFWVDK